MVKKKGELKTITKKRNFAFTYNNYTEENVESLKKYFNEKKVKYFIFGREVGEKGTPHLQGFISLKNATSLNSLVKQCHKINCKKIYIKFAIAAAIRNFLYCSKDENFYECGERPIQGKRNDLNKLAEDLKEKKTTVKQILLDKPMMFHQYGRTLTALEDTINNREKRNFKTNCTWLFGKTGTGKTKRVMDETINKSYYMVPNDNGWWDNYEGQEIVIFDDLRYGDIKYAQLLKLTDRYPYQVRRRGTHPREFVSKHIYITSSMHPEDIFTDLHEKDSLEQLYRRIIIKECKHANFDLKINVLKNFNAIPIDTFKEKKISANAVSALQQSTEKDTEEREEKDTEVDRKKDTEEGGHGDSSVGRKTDTLPNDGTATRVKQKATPSVQRPSKTPS